MLNKKFMILTICAVLLLSLSFVSAQDNATADGVSVEQSDEDVLKIEENQVTTLNDNVGTFKELSNLVQNASAGSTVKLDKDYRNSEPSDGIVISKSMTIDGQGHTIDANHLSRIFYVESNSIFLRNINFINAKHDENGGAIYFASDNIDIDNCNFIECSGEFGGVFFAGPDSEIDINKCNFINCSGEFGGAIYLDDGSTCNIVDSKFEGNVAEVLGGSLLGVSSEVTLLRTNFIENVARYESGGAITLLNSNLNAQYIEVTDCISEFGAAITLLSTNSNITHSSFKRNRADYEGGAIFAMYNYIYLDDNVFSDNTANRGGGIFASQTTSEMTNNQFINNNATKGRDLFAMSENDMSYYENNTGSNPDFYHTENDNLTINSGDYYQFKFLDDIISHIPSYYNLVDHDWVTIVKDQGVEGNCWAFSTIASLESCILKATNLTLDLSEANMKNLMAYYSDYGFRIAVNEGGHSEMAFGYLASWLGPLFEEDDYYYVNDFLSPLLTSMMHVQDILLVKRQDYRDNDNIKKAILKYGAVSTGMYFHEDFLTDAFAYYYDEFQPTNHAVCIVGWDDSYSKSNFKTAPQGDGAWIVRNSWGPSWGDSGYFYVSYYDNVFARDAYTNSFTFVLNDTVRFDRIYQLEIELTHSQNAAEACYKNIFTVEGSEYLAAVSTYFDDKCSYNIKIYVNNVLKESVQGKADAGYHTINLNNHISLNKGDEVTVEFNCTDYPTGEGRIPLSKKTSNTNLFIKRGVSYYWNGTQWIDYFWEGYVACIKMFTSFSDESKLNPFFKITSEFDASDNSYIIEAVLPGDATGTVLINYDNQQYPIDLSKTKSVKLYGVNESNNHLFAKYSGDRKYLEKSIEYIINTTISKTGNFEELSNKINAVKIGNVLNLNKDYYYESGADEGLDIAKSIIIDGHGHTISGNNLARIFNVYAKDVVFKNIKFIDSSSDYGACIQVFGYNCSIINCSFEDNYASGDGGAIYWSGNDGFVDGCLFTNNKAFSDAGAIYWNGNNGFVNNTMFNHNVASKNGGAIYWSGDNGRASNCVFANGSAFNGGAVDWSAKSGSINKCSFENNEAAYGSSIYQSGDNITIENSNFINHRGSHEVIYLNGTNNQVLNSNFTKNSHCSICLQGNNGKIVNSSFTDNVGDAVLLEGNRGLLDNCLFKNCLYSNNVSSAVYLNGDEWTISDCSFANNIGNGDGGAAFISGNDCSMINCNFTENSATNEYSHHGGGAVFWWGNNGKITGSSFINNAALYYGGAIYMDGINAEISDCYFADNNANKEGGAIYLIFTQGTVTNNLFRNNVAERGGAISIFGNGNGISNCNFSSNRAFDCGGAICLQGFYNNLTNCDFATNVADESGGAIFSFDNVILSNGSFFKNSAVYGGAIFTQGSEDSLKNSSFIENYASYGGVMYCIADDCYFADSTFEDNDASIIGGAVCWFGENGNLVNSTFINNLKNNQIYWDIGLDGTIVDCKFLKTSTGNVIYNQADFIKRSINLSYDDNSFEYNNPKVISVFLDNSYKGVPVSVPVVVTLSKEGSVKSFNVDPVDNVIKLYTELFNLEAGVWNVEVIINEDDNYNSLKGTFTINVMPAASALTLTCENLTFGQETTLSSKVYDKNNSPINEGSVTFMDGGNKIGEVKVANGAASLKYSPKTTGNHQITAVFNSNNYLSSNDVSNIDVKKADTNVVIDKTETVYCSSSSRITVHVLSNSKPVREGTIKVYIDGAEITTKPVGDGVVMVDYKAPKAGTFSVSAVFGESNNYFASNATSSFVVEKLPTSIETKAKVTVYYNAGKYVVATLKDANGKPLSYVKLSVKLPNGKISTPSTDKNGQVKILTNGLLPKNYYPAFTFAGNDPVCRINQNC